MMEWSCLYYMTCYLGSVLASLGVNDRSGNLAGSNKGDATGPGHYKHVATLR